MPSQSRNELKRLLLNITRYFLPILFVSYLVSLTFFAHVHVVNGVTIVHSHPFKKGAAHKHSTVELLLVHFLSHLTTDGAAVVFALSLFLFHSSCGGCMVLRSIRTTILPIMGWWHSEPLLLFVFPSFEPMVSCFMVKREVLIC